MTHSLFHLLMANVLSTLAVYMTLFRDSPAIGTVLALVAVALSLVAMVLKKDEPKP